MVYSIFDVDGTILDSMKIWDVLASRYIKSLGLIPEKDLDQIVSNMSLEQSANYFRKIYKLSKSQAQIIQEVLKIIEDFYQYEVQLKPGFKEFITNFDSRNVIATTSSAELVEKAFERLDIWTYFEQIFTCSQIGKSKNEPDIYCACAKYFKQKPENIYVFEDALHCIQTAKKAGFKVIGVYDRQDISSLCNVYIKDWRQIGGTTLGRVKK